MIRPSYLPLVAIYFLSSWNGFAGTIYSSFAAGEQYDPTQGQGVVAPTSIAYIFTVPSDSNYAFTGAKLALSQGIGSTNAVDILLIQDAGGLPDSTLESFHLENTLGTAGSNLPPIAVLSVASPLLVSGSQYWLAISPSVAGNGVNWNTAHYLPPPQKFAVGFGGAWTAFDIPNQPGMNYGAFSIQADAVPEPASVSLFFLGMAYLLLYRPGTDACTGRKPRS